MFLDLATSRAYLHWLLSLCAFLFGSTRQVWGACNILYGWKRGCLCRRWWLTEMRNNWRDIWGRGDTEPDWLPQRGDGNRGLWGLYDSSTGESEKTQFRGLFPRVVIRRRGMKKADFQGISMISENTKSILVLSRGLLWLLWTVKKWQNQIESARG